MRKVFKYVTILLAVVLLVSVTSLLIVRTSGNRDTEAFSEERAYRTEVSPDTEIYDEIVPGDQMAYPIREELWNKATEAFEIINAARQAQGLEPFGWSAKLEYGAKTRAYEIGCVFDKNHVRPNGTSWFTVEPSLVLAENIYKGKGDVQKALGSWLSNSSDKENFFSSEYTKIAISIYENEKGEYYWVVLFSAE
jgi:uncharacterized protein YkwD